MAHGTFRRAADAIIAMPKDDPRAVKATTQLIFALCDAVDELQDDLMRRARGE